MKATSRIIFSVDAVIANTEGERFMKTLSKIIRAAITDNVN